MRKTTYEYAGQFLKTAREEGLSRAIKNDATETLTRIKEAGSALGEKMLYGTFITAAIIGGAGMLVYHGARLGLEYAGRKREQELNERDLSGRALSLRERFNDSVRNIGNDLTSSLKENVNYGLGDFLTQDVNLRKAGALVGLVGPTVALHALAKTVHPDSTSFDNVIGMAIPDVIATLVTTPLGYLGGLYADAWLGDDKAKKSVELQNGNRRMSTELIARAQSS